MEEPIMNKTLEEIAKELKKPKKQKEQKEQKKNGNNKKVQLIYAFNGVGKTRLSKEFKKLVDSESTDDYQDKKILYYNAFTEDLFYWDNNLDDGDMPKLKIQPNTFTPWIFEEQGLDKKIKGSFQQYVGKNIKPDFNKDFSEVTFSFGSSSKENIKISKGEESCFIWSIFFTLIEAVIGELNLSMEERSTEKFNNLECIFIDDPVSSLDENHLIQLACDLAVSIKKSKSDKVKFIITTHNPLFFNVLSNEFKSKNKYLLEKQEDGTYNLLEQNNDSPFSYHIYLRNELKKAVEIGQLYKYHFNYLRNLLEKTATFLGFDKWSDLLPQTNDKANPYETRIINLSSHSKHSAEEIYALKEQDKNVLKRLIAHIDETYTIAKRLDKDK